ncbi:Hypothetical predicted protein [Olea europaea subsp. europaea]|uniref:Uncharacterized protein n=1 Tax=Olea europaea subsp. europaea TaxID=158383 RepID=A0A8S0T9U0_OLEEU|nr:Hypothetical predicted protein [Olea europaea subsp. europaea]
MRQSEINNAQANLRLPLKMQGEAIEEHTGIIPSLCCVISRVKLRSGFWRLVTEDTDTLPVLSGSSLRTVGRVVMLLMKWQRSFWRHHAIGY